MKVAPQGKREWLRAAWRIAAACVLVCLIPVGALAYLSTAPGKRHNGALLPLGADDLASARRLEADVRMLAEQVGPRHVHGEAALEAAAVHIENELRRARYEPQRLPFDVDGKTVANLEARLPGATRPADVVVVGAHYDTVPGTPGADDNASGVAAMLEISRRLRGATLDRSVWFVAFVNEEPPFFQGEGMGSSVYAEDLARHGVNVVGMLSLETMGYFADEAGSQQYIPPLQLFYPDQGDFIAFIGNLTSRALLQQTVEAFREHEPFPSEALSAPEALYAVSFSDHWSFWQVGYPAIMVTDTAFLRNTAYHKPQDTPDRLDYDRLARVVKGLSAAITALATK